MSDAAGANDPDLVLRAVLVKAADELAPEIRGLRGLLRIIDQDSPLQRDLVAALERVDSRHTLLQRAIDHYDRFAEAHRRLEDDGFPAPLPPFTLAAPRLVELTAALAAVFAAAGIFHERLPNEITADVAGAVTIDQPAPTEPGPV